MKRLLVFLALVVLGFVALRIAVGDEDVVAVKNGGTRSTDRPAASPGGVRLDQGGRRATVTLKGPFEHTKLRTLPEVDGRVVKEPVYTLRATGSQPIGNGQQELEGVEVQVFENGVHASTLTAKRAFVSLLEDANGQRSLDEAKDVDLRDAVYAALPGSSLAGLHLELAVANVRIDDDTMHLTTPRDEPVLVVFDGERRVTLRGRGAQALLPRSREAKLRRADVEILQDPVLEAEGIVVRSRGRLHFVEDVDSGAGTVTLDDEVALDLARASVAAPRVRNDARSLAPSEVHVRGDQFVAWLQRTRTPAANGKARDERDWRQLVLTGAPATLEMPGVRLSSPRVTARAGLFGTPDLITAHGGESRLEQTALRPGSRQKALLVGTSSRRLHVAMPREQLGALCGSFGMPRWAMQPLERLQVAVVEGAARLHSADDSYEARDGAHLYGFEGSPSGVAVGLGPTHIEQKATTEREHDLHATTSDGFVYTTTEVTQAPERGPGDDAAAPAAVRVVRDHLRLGPAAPADPDAPGPWRTHTIDVQHGTATMRGNGVATVERSVAHDPANTGERGDRSHDRTHAVFVSPDARLSASLPDQGLQLLRVRRLETELVGRTPESLEVAGWPVEIVVADGKDGAAATAPLVRQIGPGSLRLLPPDADRPSLWSGLAAADRLPLLRRELGAARRTGSQQVEVRGPSIDVHHAGGRAVVVDAIAVGDELPHVYARIAPREGTGSGEVTTLACGAERLRVMPFVVSPLARRWLTADAFALSTVAFHTLHAPWLVVDGVRDFQLDDPQQGHVEGRGKRLFVSQAARASLFVGDPDSLTPAEIVRTLDGRTTTMRGAQVRAVSDDDVRLEALGAFADRSTFLAPTLTLRDPQRTGLLSHMQATCRGNITVLPAEVLFSGPVTAHSLASEGSIDASGAHIDAATLHMTRNRRSHEIQLVTGTDVTLDWPRVHAQCRDVEVDLVTGRIVASDPDMARVRLANGSEIVSPRVEVNYQTLAVSTSTARIGRRDVDARRQ